MIYLHTFILFVCLLGSFSHNTGWLVLPANLEVAAFVAWIILFWVSCDKSQRGVRSFMLVIVTLVFLIGNLDGHSMGIGADGQRRWNYLFFWHVFYLIATTFSVWDWIAEERYQRAERKRQAELTSRARG